MLLTNNGAIWIGCSFGFAMMALGATVAVLFRPNSRKIFVPIATVLMILSAVSNSVAVFTSYDAGKVVAVQEGGAVLEGPNNYRIEVIFDSKKYTLKPGDVVKIEPKGNKWVVVEMTRR